MTRLVLIPLCLCGCGLEQIRWNGRNIFAQESINSISRGARTLGQPSTSSRLRGAGQSAAEVIQVQSLQHSGKKPARYWTATNVASALLVLSVALVPAICIVRKVQAARRELFENATFVRVDVPAESKETEQAKAWTLTNSFCPDCGTELHWSYRHCPECGRPNNELCYTMSAG